MPLFNKSYLKWKSYNDRDLIFKLNLNTVYKIPNINQFICKQNISKANNIFSNASLNILIFDEYPLFVKVHNTIDNKKKNNILGTKIYLSKLKFIYFFFRLKCEESFVDIKHKIIKLKDNITFLTFHINPNIFDELLFLYDKYPTLSDMSITLKFVNCKKMEEKHLLLYNFFKL